MSRIDSYEALMEERKRLENRISARKQNIKDEFNEVKSKVAPFLNLVPFLNVFKKKDPGHPILNFVSSLGIDLVGQRILSKAGWITRLILPLIAKGVSSRIMSPKTNHQAEVKPD